jgi:hypothetical protein
MCVAYRVMHGDFNADYDPTKDLFVEREVKQCALFHSLGRSCNKDLIGVARSLQVNPSCV